MNSNNVIGIVSNSEYLLQDIKNMLVLLRDVDRIECYDYFDSEDKIKEHKPNVIIIHASDNDKNALKLVKRIRETEETSKIPIIFYPDLSSTDYIVEAFDSGVSDILSPPLKDYELIMRVIWAIQKNELVFMDKVKNKFFSKLGITEENTGLCKEEFSKKFLETIINEAKENNQNSCLLLIKTKPAIDIEEDKDAFIQAMKKAIRFNDIICPKNDDSYYIFLSKSKLNGIYSVYERLLSRLTPITAISACALEVNDEIFEDIVNVLDFTMSKAPKNGEISVVKEQDFLDMYGDQEDRLEITKIFEDEKEELPVTYEEASKNIEDKQVDLGLKIMKEQVEKLGKENPKTAALKQVKEIANLEEEEIDKRNTVLYKQTWVKKLDIIVEPLLKKYAAKFQEEYSTLDANINVSPSVSYMKFDKDDIKLDLDIEYDGIKTINFNISIKALTSVLDSDTFKLSVMDIDYQNLDTVLKTLTDEYKNYL